MSRSRKLPAIAVTLGDLAGIGPEIALKALSNPRVRAACRPLLVGDAQALARLGGKNALRIRPILNPLQARFRSGTADVLHLPVPGSLGIRPGRPDAVTGAASALAVQKSVELALTGLVSGVVHAPISKFAWNEAGVGFPGHTEMLARLCGVRDEAMAIAAGPLRTVLVTRHIPFSRVPRRLKAAGIVAAARRACEWMTALGLKHPRIGVCALNPHAGEKGLIGKEELRVVGPAVEAAKRALRTAEVVGPLPADSAYRDHRKGLLDCLVTLYHDQSLIPLKLYAPEKLVNITLGLPFPRTSPGHGTAFDIAGKNRADARPMIEAILAAARLCRSK